MKKFAGTIMKTIGCLLCAVLVILNFDPSAAAVRSLPDNIYIDPDNGSEQLGAIEQPFTLVDEDGSPASGDLSERLGGDETRRLTVEIAGIPVRHVNIHLRSSVYVIPGGQTIGVSIYTDGVLVVGLGNVDTSNGKYSPAGKAGVLAGDRITSVNGVRVVDAATLLDQCSAGAGSDITLGIVRGGETMDITVTPAVDISDGAPKLGMWVRESTAGIGTLSFYVPSSLRYGALGHDVVDTDTGTLLDVREGEIMQSSIVGVTLGRQGMPGELKGTFSMLSKRLGSIDDNSSFGIFGTLDEPLKNPIYPDGIELAYPSEVHEGDAVILASVDDGGVKAYSCRIIKLSDQHSAENKSMIIEVTDEALIERTGGIVQGMSGSPIIQDGKLAGVVTHVFINEPKKGYGIYALWMYDELNGG